jgi:hypothetical protein
MAKPDLVTVVNLQRFTRVEVLRATHAPGAMFTTLYFLHDILMGPISYSGFFLASICCLL